MTPRKKKVWILDWQQDFDYDAGGDHMNLGVYTSPELAMEHALDNFFGTKYIASEFKNRCRYVTGADGRYDFKNPVAIPDEFETIVGGNGSNLGGTLSVIVYFLDEYDNGQRP